MDSNEQFLELDLKTLHWDQHESETSEKVPQGRDDHAHYFDKENEMLYIFGGYVGGAKANDLWKYDLNQKIWQQLDEGQPETLDFTSHDHN